MNTRTAFASEVSFRRNGSDGYTVIDDAASVGKAYPEVIGYVTVIRGFGHFTGDRYSHMKGIEAVIRLGGGNSPEAVAEALRNGLVHGRNDQR